MQKVVIIGPESTGKSTLSAQLAARFQTLWVPEYARAYIEGLQRPYAEEDLYRIALGQLAEEDVMAAKAPRPLLFCDTDLQVVKVWSEHRYGHCDMRILEHIAQRRYDLYLLTYIDIPWEDDPQREHGDLQMRQYFYNVYRDIVIQSGLPWADIRGDFNQRLKTAADAVNGL
ncbi:nicotinamide-nucleotide adenylyltransferase, NadR type [Chitinophaga costaii]|uniref:Nicotinamide-nucleotide adenylyltransferase, NadR type n=1 Tax=Chitinophaga costaii TaxID=1335309 RepID=A0A1C4AIS7_9BACT|nr:ATP-binding protein [Chitinophaga costaii]PUZ26624.1 ATPase [Chitinophaga costaii]SCB94604.1 nicotinamide-nucleotide adenylyltransferase, NadR type [Chitinophaga costaii]